MASPSEKPWLPLPKSLGDEMVTEGGFSSPFRAFLAFGDGFGDDFEGFRHHFVTSVEKAS